jgi:xanthine dehydrogenase small subunit
MTTIGSRDATAEAVRIRVNGRPIEVTTPGGRRLLDVLRVDLGLTGTKEGCGEGECGACSVLLDGVLVNSCLVPVSQADGCDVSTVERLATDGRLDSLQAAFLEVGGTQCGICTPGFLMAARAFLAAAEPATEAAIREAIAGNLCRCTGYTKIVEAISRAAGAGDGHAPGSPAGGAETPGTAGAGWGSGADVRGGAGSEAIRVAAPAWAGPPLVRPESLHDALARLAADPELQPVAGGTDLMVAVAAGARSKAAPLLDLWGVDELRVVEIEHDELVLGPLTTYTELRRSPLVTAAIPVLAEAAATVGAAQIQNRGTVGGNIVNASPAGDLLPVLLATDALFDLASVRGERTVPAWAFWTGYRQTALAPDELLVGIRVPLVPGRQVRFRKVGTRRAQSISKVVMAVAWQASDEAAGAAWHHARVALGSVAERPIRATATEAVLEGAVPDQAVADRAAATVEAEISPIDDVRSTAEYRRAVTGRVLRRIVLDAGRHW